MVLNLKSVRECLIWEVFSNCNNAQLTGIKTKEESSVKNSHQLSVWDSRPNSESRFWFHASHETRVCGNFCLTFLLSDLTPMSGLGLVLCTWDLVCAHPPQDNRFSWVVVVAISFISSTCFSSNDSRNQVTCRGGDEQVSVFSRPPSPNRNSVRYLIAKPPPGKRHLLFSGFFST